MKKFFCILLSILLIFIEYSYVQNVRKTILAIIPLKAIGISDDDAIQITQFLYEGLFKTGKFELIDYNQVNKKLEESQYLKSETLSVEKAVSIGKQLAVDKVIIGSVGKLGNSFIIQIRYIDVASGKLEIPDSIQADCKPSELPFYLRQLVEKIINPSIYNENATINNQKEKIKKEEQKPSALGTNGTVEKEKKKSIIPFLIIGGAAILLVVLWATNIFGGYDIRGTWQLKFTSSGSTGNGTYTCSGKKTNGTVSGYGTQTYLIFMDNFTFTGTYTVDGKSIDISGMSSLGTAITMRGQFDDKDNVSGTGNFGALFTWTAIRQK